MAFRRCLQSVGWGRNKYVRMCTWLEWKHQPLFPFPCTQSLSISDIDLQKVWLHWLNYCFFKKNIRSIVRCCLKMCVVIKILSVVLSKKNPPPFTPFPHSVWGWVGLEEEEEEYKEGGWIEFALSLPTRSKELLEWRGLVGAKGRRGWWVHHSMFNPLQSPSPFEKKCWREFCCGILSKEMARFLGTAGGGLVSAFLYSVFACPSPSEKPGQRAFFSFFPSTFSLLRSNLKPAAILNCPLVPEYLG